MTNEVTNDIVNNEHMYPLIFVHKTTNEILCLECIRKINVSEYDNYVTEYYLEGDTLQCDECYEYIESAYGPIE